MKNLFTAFLIFFGHHLCFSQKAVVELSSMNVVYIGLENPIEVAVEGLKNSQLKISANGCDVVGTPSERMYIKATLPGKCSVKVGYYKNGKLVSQTFDYRIKQLPDPDVLFGSLEEGKYSKQVLLGQIQMNAVIPCFVFSGVRYNILSYNWKIRSNFSFRTIGGKVIGNAIPDTLKRLIQIANNGDWIVIDSIECQLAGVKKLLHRKEFQIESLSGDKESSHRTNLFRLEDLECSKLLLEKGLKRDWSFDSIHFNNIDIMYWVNINMFSFFDNDRIAIPSIMLDCPVLTESEIGTGKWEIFTNNDNEFYLRIRSQNKAFNDLYKLKFIQDNNSKMLFATLISEKMRIVMKCGLDPNFNQKLIDQLVNITH